MSPQQVIVLFEPMAAMDLDYCANSWDDTDETNWR
ncbi:Hypothetical protein NGAL_HAMBI490_14240 [Neorhizobium galegae bv. officinalis]|nr:Hypothetical protein NGAL_HAMBI490_14240 [Neorhizobium galegae bv. officinalis]